MVRRFLPLGLTLLLTGCGTMPFELVERKPAAPAPTSLGTSIPPSMSMAGLPLSAGSVVSVIERQRGNALQHELTVHGAPPNHGENQVVVTAFRNVATSAEKPAEDTLPMGRPTEADIIAEMNEKLVGGAVPISPNAPQNGAGTFAYAFGKRNGVSCLYAWQWIEPENRVASAPTSVRVRLCKPGTAEEVLVDHVRQMYIMPRNRASQTPMVARGPGVGYGDALSASRGGGYARGYAGGMGYQMHPYGMVQTAAPYAAPAPAARVAAAPVQKRAVVRRVVKRRVVAPQIYSYAPTPPAVTASPALRTGGYSAVPMPQ